MYNGYLVTARLADIQFELIKKQRVKISFSMIKKLLGVNFELMQVINEPKGVMNKYFITWNVIYAKFIEGPSIQGQVRIESSAFSF